MTVLSGAAERKDMKQVIIVSGGTLDDVFAERAFREIKPDAAIAADSGMGYFYRSGKKPDIIIGDFDSVKSEALSYFRGQPDIEIRELVPEKDDTDTEAAIWLAISRGAEEITLLGATGSRLDHVLGNIELLGIGLQCGVSICMCDANNRIRMTDCGMKLRRDGQFGTYVSLIPYTEQVEHLTLTGFKYPLTDACLKGFCSLGVSNEIKEEEAEIVFDGGILLVIESRDVC